MATIPASGPSAAPSLHGDSIMLAEILLDLAERAQAYTNAAGVAIALIRGKELLVRTSTGTAPEVGTTISLSDALVAECLRTRKPVGCRDVESDNRVGPAFRALGSRSVMAVPVCEVRDVRGMMLVLARQPNAFQPAHTSILMTLSDIVAAKLREHESPSVVEIPFFDEADGAEEVPPDPVSALSIFDPQPEMTYEPPASVPSLPETAKPAFGPAVVGSQPSMVAPAAQPPLAVPSAMPPVVEHPQPAVVAHELESFELPAEISPDPLPAMAAFTEPAAPPATPPAAQQVDEPVASSPTSSVFTKLAAMASPAEPARPVATPTRTETPPVSRPRTVFTKVAAVLAASAEPAKPPVTAPPSPLASKPASVAAKSTPPASAGAPGVPLGCSPELPLTPALALMEEKIETAERDPALLPPAEDPRGFKPQRSFVATTVGPTVSTTAATTIPRATVKPFVVATPAAITAAPAAAAPVVAPAAAAPAPVPASLAATSLASWDQPERKSKSWMFAAAAIAVVLAVAVGLWMSRAASVPGPAPVAPVPAVAAQALPPVAPPPAASSLTSDKSAVAEARTEKRVSAKEAQLEEAAPRESAPVMQIATGSAEPRPEPPAEMPAPQLNLSSNDTSIKTLSRVSVAVPAAPKSHLVAPELVSQTRPVYPPMARQLGIYGSVLLHVTINKDGSVGDVRVVDGAVQLRKAAADAVRNWRYKPATLNGDPIEATAEVKIRFTK